jgi:RHS repeat-associated protein
LTARRNRWNLIAELANTETTGRRLPATVLRSYLWGLDLSGSMQGAGGVGGLLAITLTSQGTFMVNYDGNGNIVGLVDGHSGALADRYTYDPFGNEINRGKGSHLNQPFGFSTKFKDEDIGLIYYGYRYYSPTTGKWVNRDPLYEKAPVDHANGFIFARHHNHNRSSLLYAHNANDSINHYDILGLERAGSEYDSTVPAGHHALELYGNSYGFGPVGSFLFATIGTTYGWGYGMVPRPRNIYPVNIRYSGHFADDENHVMLCLCATPSRIIECANYYQAEWEGSVFAVIGRNCRSYVSAIVNGCCLSVDTNTWEYDSGDPPPIVEG